MRVLLELGRFPAGDAAALYAGARGLDWRAWLDTRSTLAVSADVSDTPELTHSGFAALKVKDGVVDALREALGARPDVDARDPDVSIRLHLQAGEAKVFLDLAGEPLHRRGYRVAMTEAPLKESLAAAILTLGRVDVALPFWDPMAGSGTLAIEQALLARDIAPGLRRSFGFQRWPAFAHGAWHREWVRLVDEAEGRVLPRAPAPIVCGDRFTAPSEAARQNAAAAGVADDLTFELADVRALEPRWAEGNLVMNPPYGERLMAGAPSSSPSTFAPAGRFAGARVEARAGRPATGRARFGPAPGAPGPAPASSAWPQGAVPPSAAEKEAEVQRLKLVGLYRGMAEAMRRFRGWGVVVLSGSAHWAEPVPFRPIISHKLFNGPLEVRLLRYEMPTDGSAPEERRTRPGGRRPPPGRRR
jgi:putative N6-adenine-specific DNA methylase